MHSAMITSKEVQLHAQIFRKVNLIFVFKSDYPQPGLSCPSYLPYQ